MLNDALRNVCVIGAAGKMGCGIALLLLQEMACREAETTGNVGQGGYRLILIDANEEACFALRQHLRKHLLKYAEKNINALRLYYEKNLSLVSNEDMIRAFVEGALDMVLIENTLEKAKDSSLIFEAIVEDVAVKTALYNTLNKARQRDQYYFTNTSSIPIEFLDKTCHLKHRIIGFHFYNPPLIQKLVEIISPDELDPRLYSLAVELARRLEKTVVHARDIAGFIGNGHFIREVLFACTMTRQVVQEHALNLPQAIFLVNCVTQDYLLRPMGIFQLIDYVGIDVCQNIMTIMQRFLSKDVFHEELIDAMVSAGNSGGQYPDGSQKNGFFQYEGHHLIGVYSLEEGKYQPLDREKTQCLLGERPYQELTWKNLHQNKSKKEKIETYFQQLFRSDTVGATLAKAYLLHSEQIAHQLVKDGVTETLTDVDSVLLNGFWHLYGVELQKTT